MLFDLSNDTKKMSGKSHGYLEDVNHVPAGLLAGYSLSLLNLYSCHAYIEITSYLKLLGLMKHEYCSLNHFYVMN